MNSETLNRTGILIAYYDYSSKEYDYEKDAEIQIHTSFDVFFDNVGLHKEYNLAKNRKKNIKSKIVKYENKYFSINSYEEQHRMKLVFVDISGVYQSRLNATKELLVLLIAVFRKNPVLTSVLFSLISVSIWFIKDNIAQVQKENLRLSQELKEMNVKFLEDNKQDRRAIKVILERLESQDSINRIVIETQIEIIKRIGEKQYYNTTIADIQKKMLETEARNTSLITELAVVDYMMPEVNKNLNEIRKFELSQRFQEMKDSVEKSKENERERKHRVFKRKD